MDVFHEQQRPKLIGLIYDAALDQSRWPAFLEALPGAFGGCTGILRLCPNATQPSRDLPYGCDMTFIGAYAEHFASVNPYEYSILHSLPVGSVIYASEYAPADFIEKTEFYNDWMAPQGITSDHLGCSLHREGDQTAMIAVAPHASVFRSDRQRYADQLQQLAPHLVRAVAINRQLAASVRIERALGQSLDAVGAAAFVLSPTGQLQHANALGEAMLAANDAIGLTRDRSLAVKNTAAASALAATIAQAAAGGPEIHPPVRLTSRTDGAAYLAWVLPMRESTPQSGGLRLLDALDRQGAILVLVTRADRQLRISADLVRTAFNLTVAEARLVEALVAGATLADYAASSGVTRNTLRNQLASVFGKTGTNRQAELVARVLTTVGPFAGGW